MGTREAWDGTDVEAGISVLFNDRRERSHDWLPPVTSDRLVYLGNDDLFRRWLQCGITDKFSGATRAAVDADATENVAERCVRWNALLYASSAAGDLVSTSSLLPLRRSP